MRYAVLLALVACGKHDRVEHRAPAPPIPPIAGRATGSAAEPPADARLTAVPADVVGHVALHEVVHGLDRPVLAIAAPGAPHRLYIVEQRGRIRIFDNGALKPDPWFTIGDLSDGNEEGLLGLAFHPDFAKNGRIFVNYTSRDMATHIVEYRATAERVDPTSAHELIRIAQPYSNHNGGNLVFGPDGKLYTGMGDGGKANDPHGNGQNPKALLGKILRFDVSTANPAPEIVHLGMRNPWRFAFDRDGTLYIGDVGQNLWEEVDVAPPGSQLNFGWNVLEGTHCFDARTGMTADTCDRTGLTLPVAIGAERADLLEHTLAIERGLPVPVVADALR